MKIVEPSVEIYFHFPRRVTLEEDEIVMGELILPENFLERVGRTCYKSEDRITTDSAAKFITMLDNRNHKAMLEHCFASVKFVCDRGVTHEAVRHRLASFAQESTRYCNYTKNKFGNEISVIKPPFEKLGSTEIWKETLSVMEDGYKRLIENGEPPQLARSVLPISVKTELWFTANLREWQHVYTLRTSNAAHPQIHALMKEALDIFRHVAPNMFEKLWTKVRVFSCPEIVSAVGPFPNVVKEIVAAVNRNKCECMEVMCMSEEEVEKRGIPVCSGCGRKMVERNA